MKKLSGVIIVVVAFLLSGLPTHSALHKRRKKPTKIPKTGAMKWNVPVWAKEGTYMIKVWSYSKTAGSHGAMQKNAVHAVIFQDLPEADKVVHLRKHWRTIRHWNRRKPISSRSFCWRRQIHEICRVLPMTALLEQVTGVKVGKEYKVVWSSQLQKTILEKISKTPVSLNPYFRDSKNLYSWKNFHPFCIRGVSVFLRSAKENCKVIIPMKRNAWVEMDGSQTLKAWGTGNTNEDAIEQAKRTRCVMCSSKESKRETWLRSSCSITEVNALRKITQLISITFCRWWAV